MAWSLCQPEFVAVSEMYGWSQGLGSDLGYVSPRLWLRLRFIGVKVWVRSGSPCEPEVVVESEAWLESRVGVGPGSPCELVCSVSCGWCQGLWLSMCPRELEVVVESESWLESSVLIGPESP